MHCTGMHWLFICSMHAGPGKQRTFRKGIFAVGTKRRYGAEELPTRAPCPPLVLFWGRLCAKLGDLSLPGAAVRLLGNDFQDGECWMLSVGWKYLSRAVMRYFLSWLARESLMRRGKRSIDCGVYIPVAGQVLKRARKKNERRQTRLYVREWVGE